MGGLTSETNGGSVENRAGKEINVQVGELILVKLNESSWWPAQLVDENLVSAVNKPSSKGSSSDVLVWLYGSYVYKYADIHSLSAEFKRNHFNYHDILKKSLDHVINLVARVSFLSSYLTAILFKIQVKRNTRCKMGSTTASFFLTPTIIRHGMCKHWQFGI